MQSGTPAGPPASAPSPRNQRTPASAAPGYQLFILALCLYGLAALGVQSTIALEPRVRDVLDHADFAICLIFLVDFGISLWNAENRWRYFMTWGWLDLLSAIPMVDVARAGRLARVFRIFRVLRGLRIAKFLSSLILRQRAQNGFLAASLTAILLIIFASVAILQFETGPDANIVSAQDAIWWAITTITTVGYGDRFPVTLEGRMVAGVLMLAGVGLFSVFSGFLASWFIAPESQAEQSELDALRLELAALRQLLEERLSVAKGPADADGLRTQ